MRTLGRMIGLKVDFKNKRPNIRTKKLLKVYYKRREKWNKIIKDAKWVQEKPETDRN